MTARPLLFCAALAAVASVSGCGTMPDIKMRDIASWLPGKSAPPFEITQDKTSLQVQFHGVALKDSKLDGGGTEIALLLATPADAAEFADVQSHAPAWIIATHTDGNTANIVARAAGDMSATPTSDGFVLKIEPRDLASEFRTINAGDAGAEDARVGMQREDLALPFGVAETSPPEAPPRGSL